MLIIKNKNFHKIKCIYIFNLPVVISGISISSVQVLKERIPGVNCVAELPAVPKEIKNKKNLTL